ncbi:MAG TPA: tetratricopeptide repeat protein [Promineifilum sp.]|nr:tetratricopeptide repeat protein [Promineifilum sp.]
MKTGVLVVVAVIFGAAGCASPQNDTATLDCSSPANPCADWSAVDRKYAARDPSLFGDVVRARELLDSWFGKGQHLLDAAELLENVLRKDSEFAPAFLEYGRLFQKAALITNREYDLERLAEARTWIFKAIEIEPDYVDAFIILSSTYINAGRHAEARAALARAEAMGSDDPGIEINHAVMLRREGQDDAALERYERVIEQGKKADPAYAVASGMMANIYSDQGRYEEAKAAHELKLEVEPESAWNWGGYSRFLIFRYGDVDGAIASARKALSIMNYGDGRFVLACALFTKWALMVEETGDTEATQAVFDEAIGLYPDVERIIQMTGAHEPTKVAATQLARWMQTR